MEFDASGWTRDHLCRTKALKRERSELTFIVVFAIRSVRRVLATMTLERASNDWPHTRSIWRSRTVHDGQPEAQQIDRGTFQRLQWSAESIEYATFRVPWASEVTRLHGEGKHVLADVSENGADSSNKKTSLECRERDTRIRKRDAEGKHCRIKWFHEDSARSPET